MGTEWLTVEEIAQELKMHVDTVRGWIREGKLKATRFGRDYRTLASFDGTIAAGAEGVHANGPDELRYAINSAIRRTGTTLIEVPLPPQK